MVKGKSEQNAQDTKGNELNNYVKKGIHVMIMFLTVLIN